MSAPKQSEFEVFVHLMKSCLATGILAMPLAFNNAGLVLGTFGTILVTVISTHCANILAVCAQELRTRTEREELSFAEVAEEACRSGPPWSQKYGHFAKILVDVGIFATYFGICSSYIVIMAENFQKVITVIWMFINLRIYIIILFVPLLLLSYIPNLKYLIPVSLIANIFMFISLGIILYYIIKDLPSPKDRRLAEDIIDFPSFFSITIFAVGSIGAVMPLTNSMKRPEKFSGFCGVLSQAMIIITAAYILLGLLGYIRFGDAVNANIALNLPSKEAITQVVQCLIGLFVFGTFGIQFFICLDIAWNNIKHKYGETPVMANYILRSLMVTVTVLLALLVPQMGPFISLIGAFFFSITGILLPVGLEIITFWENGYGKYHWIAIKDGFVTIIGIMALVLGTRDAVADIIKLYH